MRQLFIGSLSVFMAGSAMAQVKVGANPTSLQNGQLFQLEKTGTRGGLKMAEVALTGMVDVTTINIPTTAVGTMIWTRLPQAAAALQ